MNEELFDGEFEAGCQAVQEGLDILSAIFCEGNFMEDDDIDFANIQLDIMRNALADLSTSFCF